ncbi:hypothetical protein HCTV-15_gp99 [Haloarcula virus HCTV-15]|uniref:Uncharacterized protein n=1 Tax=Halorubrum sodomense tailed virus 2 TaxID=1262527 RepID=L7THP7_9CAUD|nr:hypothetical protein HSTV2_99 [Halorubrum sodomense tailed virus 2]AGC34366.1 hypothetical protein HSTV2_99 [Halorubrum sodomense tailed virus 2]UBF22466.1 hypothetical protein HCTV-6_gp99 [Haloarcula virus HCTV-6]UBF22573.1 hypothetical protein HCTV-15_gp99 [Haloarcula virus HCTV-15]
MSDDDWNHRSQFTGPRDPGLKAVSANVNERATGPNLSRQETEAYIADGRTNRERREEMRRKREAEAPKDERRLHEHYDPRHIPDSYWESVEDGKTGNRERLLNGETV